MQPVPEARLWVEQVASRLWMMQTSFGDDPPNTRHDYLFEEIERSIKDVGGSKRSEYLALLMERFPGPERIDAPYFEPLETETVERGPQEIADELNARLPELSNEANQMLEKTRQLTAGLLSAIGPAREIFARKHLDRFAPEKIRAGIESKSSAFISNVELRCWRRYVELAADLSGHAIETQIVDGIVSYTEELISRSEIRGR
jgi:hypothetical protein